MEYEDYDDKESIGVDINGVELEDGMLLRTTLSEANKILYCVMQGEATGLYYLVALLTSVNDIVIKPILEAENYEFSYYEGQDGFYENYRDNKNYSRVLASL